MKDYDPEYLLIWCPALFAFPQNTEYYHIFTTNDKNILPDNYSSISTISHFQLQVQSPLGMRQESMEAVAEI